MTYITRTHKGVGNLIFCCRPRMTLSFANQNNTDFNISNTIFFFLLHYNNTDNKQKFSVTDIVESQNKDATMINIFIFRCGDREN